MPAGASSSQARQLTTGSRITGLSWTKDGQLLTSAGANGLALVNPESGAKTPLLSQLSFPSFVRACSDGHIVFSAAAAGKTQNNLWVADADGGNARKLTSGKFDFLPACSSDAKTVLYADADGKLAKVPLEGGASQQLAELEVFSRITISPDGKLAAFDSFRLGDPKEKLVLLPLDSGQPPRFIEFERPRAEFAALGDAPVRLTADGKAVAYPIRDGNTDNIWLQQLDGSPGKALTDFKSELIRDFDWSQDGKQLAVIRGHKDSDVVLIRDLEK